MVVDLKTENLQMFDSDVIKAISRIWISHLNVFFILSLDDNRVFFFFYFSFVCVVVTDGVIICLLVVCGCPGW